MSGYELSRFTGVFGLEPDDARFGTTGQQAPQFVLEEVLREEVQELAGSRLELDSRVIGLEQFEDEVHVRVADASGERTVRAQYVIGADGPRSAVRDAIGARYVGGAAMRPNFGLIFRAPELWQHVAHGRAVQYWILNPFAPGVIGPLDGGELWWAGFIGVDRERGERDGQTLLSYAIGTPTPTEILSTDPWTAKMQLVDTARRDRVLLVGDAAHLNPPWGGHGLNTGLGDAVDVGWKLAAVLDGWGGPALLDSYEAERRPVHAAVIAEAQANMTVLPSELSNPDVAASGPAGDGARARADVRIQETKHREYHALDLVLGTWADYAGSPVVLGAPHSVTGDDIARPGRRLPHARLADGASVFDALGNGFTLMLLGSAGADTAATWEQASAARGVPLRTLDLSAEALTDRYGAECVLVRPDQHVAWCGDGAPADLDHALDTVRGAARQRQPA